MKDTLHLTCPHCSGINRVLQDKLDHSPSCGRCGGPLLPGAPLDLDGATLDRMAARDELPLLVNFWSASCGPCRMMAPALDEAARRLAPGIRTAKVQMDLHPDAGTARGVRSVPTTLLFRNGREAARISGALDASSLTNWVRSNP